MISVKRFRPHVVFAHIRYTFLIATMVKEFANILFYHAWLGWFEGKKQASSHPSFCLLQWPQKQIVQAPPGWTWGISSQLPLIQYPLNTQRCFSMCCMVSGQKKKKLSWDRNIFLVCHVRKGSLSASMHFLSQCEMWEYLWNSMCNGGKSLKDTRHFV